MPPSAGEGLFIPDYDRDEADPDTRVFPPALTGSPTDYQESPPLFEIRDDYLIPVEAGQAVNKSWPTTIGGKPLGVTWHWAVTWTLAQLRAILGGSKPTRKGDASAHYGVGRTFAEGVDRYVSLENRSWHAGKGQLLRLDGRLLGDDDYKGSRSTIGVETVHIGYAAGDIQPGADWARVYAADCTHQFAIQPWTEEQLEMMIAVGREIVATWPHIGMRDHHGHEDLCPGYKIDVAGFPFARLLQGIYRDPTIPDVWTPLHTVKARQRALIYLEFDLGPSGADGSWGPRSRAALAGFQKEQGLGQLPYWTTAVNWKLHDLIEARGAHLADVAAG